MSSNKEVKHILFKSNDRGSVYQLRVGTAEKLQKELDDEDEGSSVDVFMRSIKNGNFECIHYIGVVPETDKKFLIIGDPDNEAVHTTDDPVQWVYDNIKPYIEKSVQDLEKDLKVYKKEDIVFDNNTLYHFNPFSKYGGRCRLIDVSKPYPLTSRDFEGEDEDDFIGVYLYTL